MNDQQKFRGFPRFQLETSERMFLRAKLEIYIYLARIEASRDAFPAPIRRSIVQIHAAFEEAMLPFHGFAFLPLINAVYTAQQKNIPAFHKGRGNQGAERSGTPL